MATNAKDEEVKDEETNSEAETSEVTDADLKKLKDEVEGVESEKSEDEPKAKDEAKTEKAEDTEGEKDATTEEEAKAESETFERKFKHIKGEQPTEYAKNLEKAYDESTTEALKWKKLYEDAQPALKKAGEIVEGEGDPAAEPALVYARQRMQEDIDRDIADFSKSYPQMSDPEEYKKLEAEVGVISRAIRESQNRIPSMKEVLDRAASFLDWEKGDGEEVAAAVKDSASTAKTSSAAKASSSKSKVSDAQVKVARQLFPGMKDEEIRKELEAYV